MLNIFIGAMLAIVLYTYGLLPFIIALVLLIKFHPRPKSYIKLPNQKLLFQKIASLKVEKYSETIIGSYKGNPIHEYIVVKNPANDVSYRYNFNGNILFNEHGQIVYGPVTGEVFLPTGLIYKDTGIVVTNQ